MRGLVIHFSIAYHILIQPKVTDTKRKSSKKLKPLDLAVDPDDLRSEEATDTKKKSAISEVIKPDGSIMSFKAELNPQTTNIGL